MTADIVGDVGTLLLSVADEIVLPLFGTTGLSPVLSERFLMSMFWLAHTPFTLRPTGYGRSNPRSIALRPQIGNRLW